MYNPTASWPYNKFILICVGYCSHFTVYVPHTWFRNVCVCAGYQLAVMQRDNCRCAQSYLCAKRVNDVKCCDNCKRRDERAMRVHYTQPRGMWKWRVPTKCTAVAPGVNGAVRLSSLSSSSNRVVFYIK